MAPAIHSSAKVSRFMSESDNRQATSTHSMSVFVWESSDGTCRNLVTPSVSDQPRQHPYYQNAMDWNTKDEGPSGAFTISAGRSKFDDDDIYDDQESFDRITLLAKKYADEEVKLTKEDSARLEMINQKMDVKYPRYTARDWELLDEADSLINELSNFLGR